MHTHAHAHARTHPRARRAWTAPRSLGKEQHPRWPSRVHSCRACTPRPVPPYDASTPNVACPSQPASPCCCAWSAVARNARARRGAARLGVTSRPSSNFNFPLCVIARQDLRREHHQVDAVYRAAVRKQDAHPERSLTVLVQTARRSALCARCAPQRASRSSGAFSKRQKCSPTALRTVRRSCPRGQADFGARTRAARLSRPSTLLRMQLPPHVSPSLRAYHVIRP
jgi:hypothetical protein